MAFALAGLALLGWALLVSINVPLSDTDGGGDQSVGSASASDRSQGSGLTPEQLQVFVAIDLRRPLKDPPPVVVAPPPMQARLLGTIYEPANPSQSQALFQLGDGSQRFFRAGQQFNEPGGVVVIKHVGDQVASVEYRDEQRELKVGSP